MKEIDGEREEREKSIHTRRMRIWMNLNNIRRRLSFLAPERCLCTAEHVKQHEKIDETKKGNAKNWTESHRNEYKWTIKDFWEKEREREGKRKKKFEAHEKGYQKSRTKYRASYPDVALKCQHT